MLITKLVLVEVELVIVVRICKDHYSLGCKDLYSSYKFIQIWWDHSLDVPSSLLKGMTMQSNIGICAKPSGGPAKHRMM